MVVPSGIAFTNGEDGEGGETDGPSIGHLLSDDGQIFLEDGIAFFRAPLHFSSGDWILTGSVIAGTPLLMSTDNAIHTRVARNTLNGTNGDFWDIPTAYGSVPFAGLFSLGTYTAGLVFRDDAVRITGRMCIEALAFSGLSVLTVRYAFGRSRPFLGEGAWKFNWFEWKNEKQSFPSGHTTAAFALSTVLADRIDNIWATVLLYGVASLTGFARMYNNQHWFSDVVIGAGAGFLGGHHAVVSERKRQDGSDDGSFRFLLSPSGVSVTWILK